MVYFIDFGSWEFGVQTSALGAGVQTRMSYLALDQFASPDDDPPTRQPRLISAPIAKRQPTPLPKIRLLKKRWLAFEEILLYDSSILLPQERKNMTRVDGRANDELRPVSISLDFTESPDASVLVKFGKTIVWCSASVQNEQPRWMKYEGPENKGWVTAEYSMMPGSTSPRNRREGRRGSIGGRTHEIQRLIGRSLRAVTDLEKLGPKTYTIDCDVLQADGGTRTASITGAFVALAIAVQKQIDKGDLTELPFRDSLAAISCGIVDGIPMLDLPYTEDVAADVDMNVVMTGNGSFVEVQGTGEESVFSADELSALLKLAGKGVKDLTAIQAEAVKDYPNLVKFFTK